MVAIKLLSTIYASPVPSSPARAKALPRLPLNTACRDERGLPLSCGQLARRIGCSRSTAWRILDGSQPMTDAQRVALERSYGR